MSIGAVYVTRKDGKQPSQDEVYTLLKDHKISEVWTPTMTEMETHGLGNGIWVRFEFYGECKEAVKVSSPCFLLLFKLTVCSFSEMTQSITSSTRTLTLAKRAQRRKPTVGLCQHRLI